MAGEKDGRTRKEGRCKQRPEVSLPPSHAPTLTPAILIVQLNQDPV